MNPQDTQEDNRPRLPTAFYTDDGQSITEPVYRCMADGYYGETLWLEGEIIVTQITPNHHLQPLNAAAEDRYQKWIDMLPHASAALRTEDLQEAAVMLQHQLDREGLKMNHAQFSEGTIKMASSIKQRRDAYRNSGVTADTRAARTSAAAPMPNANFSDVHAGMQANTGPVQRAAQQRSQSVARRAKPALSGGPIPDPQPGQ